MSASDRRLAALALFFFLSGVAALLFETLWFRLAGLTFGNAAWATAAVLGSFMAGLALGSALALRLRARAAAAPLRMYAMLEAAVGVAGFALVLLLPASSAVLAPLFHAAGATRIAVAFLMMLVPTSLMGATLPTLVGGLTDRENYGQILALLYGANTLGAVAGALIGELTLIETLGLRGTAAVALLCSLAAAAGAFVLGRGDVALPSRQPARRRLAATRGMLATAIAGFVLLALEVLWMRVIVLFVFATSLAFAIMLAVLLFGIGAGSLLAAAIARRFPDADNVTACVAALAAVAVVLSYDGFAASALPFSPTHLGLLLAASVRLMLPVSVLSGMLFPSIGRQIERATSEPTFATAALTAANTLGGAAGSLVATFLLIPRFGVDAAISIAAAGYVVVALLTLPAASRLRLAALASAAIAAVVIVVMPHDRMLRSLIPAATRFYRGRDTRVRAVVQGPIETAVYLERTAFGAPYVERLYTNGYSMSATSFASKRYMSLFVHLPMAMRPAARSALLISYGVGVTAHALTSTPQLQSIDVVDISKTILSLSPIVWPGGTDPLRDPRVRVHVEDGRFFLMTAPQRFDLITAEPPPPKGAGIVNLYTREYFALLRGRLTEGGLATYWLPVYQLAPDEARAIVGAFCSELDDCSLWSGAGGDWILLGSRGPMRAVTAADFATPWRTPASADWLARVGVERAEVLCSLFLADTATLKRWASSSPPLTDDFPLRLSNRVAPRDFRPWLPFLDRRTRAAAFAASPLLRRVLPPELLRDAPRYFGLAQLTDRMLFVPNRQTPVDARIAHAVLTGSDLRDAPRVLLGSDRWIEDLARAAWARGDRSADAMQILGIGALCDRHYAEAAGLLDRARAMTHDPEAAALAVLAATLANDRAGAERIIAASHAERAEWDWLLGGAPSQ